MNKGCDLHIHSTFSDGSSDMPDIIERAINEKLKYISITDHDLYSVRTPGKIADTFIIPGCEYSAKYTMANGNTTIVHIIGLFPMGIPEPEKSLADRYTTQREAYFSAIIHKLQGAGVDIDSDRVKNTTDSMLLGRAIIAQYLIKNEYVHTFEEAFKQYLGRERPDLFVDETKYISYMALPEIVSEVIRLDGIPVLCHPLLYFDDDKELKKLIQTFCESTTQRPLGIEVFYGSYTDKERSFLLDLCKRYDQIYGGLFPSGGSDSHGPDTPLAHEDEQLFENMLEAYRNRRNC